jgi:hypothetical protein
VTEGEDIDNKKKGADPKEKPMNVEISGVSLYTYLIDNE